MCHSGRFAKVEKVLGGKSCQNFARIHKYLLVFHEKMELLEDGGREEWTKNEFRIVTLPLLLVIMGRFFVCMHVRLIDKREKKRNTPTIAKLVQM